MCCHALIDIGLTVLYVGYLPTLSSLEIFMTNKDKYAVADIKITEQ